MDKKEFQSRQINVTSNLCMVFEADCENEQERIDTLRSMLRIKEIGARKLFNMLTTQIMPLRNYGISNLSVLSVAEALESELVTNLSEMEVIADRLAAVTHNINILNAYSSISERLLGDVTEMLDGMKIAREEAVNDDNTLQKIEWGDMWDSLNSDIKQQIS